jgi:hypothetical protein
MGRVVYFSAEIHVGFPGHITPGRIILSAVLGVYDPGGPARFGKTTTHPEPACRGHAGLEAVDGGSIPVVFPQTP